MKISSLMATFLAIAFAAVCLGFAITGFTSLSGIADPIQASDAKGFAWFWTFLASVALLFGLLSWWIARTEKSNQDA